MEGAAMKNSSGKLLSRPQQGILNYVNQKRKHKWNRKSDDFTASFYITTNFRSTAGIGLAL
jgi:hypothetical protein